MSSTLAQARTNPRYQALDQSAVELYDSPTSEDPDCYICGSGNDEKVGGASQHFIWLEHTLCSHRAHLKCMLDWFKSACFCPICKGCFKGHDDSALCRRVVPVSEDLERIPDAILFPGDQSQHWSYLSEPDMGGVHDYVNWLRGRALTESDIFPDYAHSLNQYAVDVLHDDRHYRQTLTPPQLGDIGHMNSVVREARRAWLRQWNWFADRFLHFCDVSLSPQSSLYGRDYCRNIVTAFLTLRTREKLADFLYLHTTGRFVGGHAESHIIKPSNQDVERLSCLFTAEARIKPYELSHEVLASADEQAREALARMARAVWLKRRIFASENFNAKVQQYKHLFQTVERVWREFGVIACVPLGPPPPSPAYFLFD